MLPAVTIFMLLISILGLLTNKKTSIKVVWGIGFGYYLMATLLWFFPSEPIKQHWQGLDANANVYKWRLNRQMTDISYEQALINLNATYKNRKVNILGRDLEVDLILESLLCVRKPNVILKGEPGVGKTSLVYYIAHLIANGKVPKELLNHNIIELNLNSLLAGDGYRGVFEKKVDNLIQEVMQRRNTILFVDEIHGAENLGKLSNGQTPGLSDTLKPYLARGDIKVIGATTNQDYDKITDKAFLRRFMTVNIQEPDEKTIKEIIVSCFLEFNTRGCIVEDPDYTMNKIYDLSLQLKGGANPDKAVNIVDYLFARSKFRNCLMITIDFVNACCDDMLAMERIR